MGGEKFQSLAVESASAGSPPHGRGKAEYQAAMDTVDGITPAWAGKSSPAFLSWPGNRDHPRVGGEKEQLHKEL